MNTNFETILLIIFIVVSAVVIVAKALYYNSHPRCTQCGKRSHITDWERQQKGRCPFRLWKCPKCGSWNYVCHETEY